MRYPGPSFQERQIRTIIGGLAALFFVSSLFLAVKKGGQLEASQTVTKQPSARPTVVASPVAAQSVRFRFLDGETQQPIKQQAIGVVVSPICDTTSTCPAPTPLFFTTDQEGRTAISKELVKQTPKLYSLGYKLDTYFFFGVAAQPDHLMLYRPLSSQKVTYDISKEEVVVGLFK